MALVEEEVALVEEEEAGPKADQCLLGPCSVGPEGEGKRRPGLARPLDQGK